jgi:hypothetical protein
VVVTEGASTEKPRFLQDEFVPGVAKRLDSTEYCKTPDFVCVCHLFFCTLVFIAKIN